MSTEELMVLQMAEQQAERKARDEYRESKDPIGLLYRRVYDLIACSASSVLDYHESGNRPAPPLAYGKQWPSIEDTMSRTAKRMVEDPLFHRLVDMQAAGIMREIERYREAFGFPR